MNSGCLALILHAHLPWVRHPEHERFLEESWFYEALSECYLPLLRVLGGWATDKVQARITLSVSPTLAAMLADPLLRERFQRRLEAQVELAEQEVFRTRWLGLLNAAAEFHAERFRWLHGFYTGLHGDVLGALRSLADTGVVELMTCSATHALLPFLAEQPGSLRAQAQLAQTEFTRWAGRPSQGFWLPECSYNPAVEPALKAAGFRWFVVETHGLHHATPRPSAGHLAPAITPQGLGVIARDPESARQVWSREIGYPGDFAYRDFYRDIGFELDLDYVEPCLPSPGLRGLTGFKYSRITGPTDAKEPYDRAAALERTREHARHFVESRPRQLEQATGTTPLLLTAPYDAELFGHWWFEGPEFLDQVGRIAAANGLKMVTPSEFFSQQPDQPVVQPAASSWGEHGYWRLWLNEGNAWIQGHLRPADRRMTEMVEATAALDTAAQRLLKEAARELLLAQASDWPFILRTGTSPEYARQRVIRHLERFWKLERHWREDTGPDQSNSAEDLFPTLDPAWWNTERKLQAPTSKLQ
jgi:1,4-alpha-glucan branching enzyme